MTRGFSYSNDFCVTTYRNGFCGSDIPARLQSQSDVVSAVKPSLNTKLASEFALWQKE